MTDKPNCHTCQHVRSIPGDAHKSCANKTAKVQGYELGRRKGWFFWPYNFDPVWLESCDGYMERD